MKRFKVTCLECGESDIVTIDEDGHQMLMQDKVMQTPIASARWRKDLEWGFECFCGNYDLLSNEEKGDWKKLISGSPLRIAQIVQILAQKPKKRFNMVEQ